MWRGSTVVACWTCTGGNGIESWSSRTFLLFHTAAMLFYIVQGVIVPELSIFRRPIAIHHCVTGKCW
jgi:hypothetical protein